MEDELNLSGLTLEGLYKIVLTPQTEASYRIDPKETVEKTGSRIAQLAQPLVVGGGGGTPVGAIFGYLYMLAELARGHEGFANSRQQYGGSLFKKEFCILLCTKDKKYASVRKRLSTSGGRDSASHSVNNRCYCGRLFRCRCGLPSPALRNLPHSCPENGKGGILRSSTIRCTVGPTRASLRSTVTNQCPRA
jgi:hypothetical protein